MKPLRVVALAVLLSACAGGPPPAVESLGERYLREGVTALADDRYAASATALAKALEYFQARDDANGALRAHLNLAELALAAGQTDGLRAHLDAAERTLPRAAGLPDAAPRLRLLRAALAYRERDWNAAEATLAPLLPRFEGEAPQGPLTPVSRAALANRVLIAFARDGDDPALWTRRYARALEREPAAAERGRLHRFEAELAHRAGDTATARERLDAALAAYKAASSRPGIAATLEELATLAAPEPAAARDLLRRALDVRLGLMDRAGTAAVLRRLAEAERRLGHVDAAVTAERWAEALEQPGFRDWGRVKGEIAPL